MTNYLFIKVTEDTLNSPAFLNLAPFVKQNSFGMTVTPFNDMYRVFELNGFIEKMPISLGMIKMCADFDSKFVSPSVSDPNAPNVIFSSLDYAPAFIYRFNTDPEYLDFEKRMAQDLVKLCINDPEEYHANPRYQEMDLYNSFHPDAPVHLIGSDDVMSLIHTVNLA